MTCEPFPTDIDQTLSPLWCTGISAQPGLDPTAMLERMDRVIHAYVMPDVSNWVAGMWCDCYACALLLHERLTTAGQVSTVLGLDDCMDGSPWVVHAFTASLD